MEMLCAETWLAANIVSGRSTCMVRFGNRIIDRYAQQHDTQTGPGEFGFVHEQQNADSPRQHHIQQRQHRVTECLIRSRPFRFRLSEPKYTEYSQDIKDQHHKDHIIQQFIVFPAETEDGCPDALYPQRTRWHRIPVEDPDPAEEYAIPSHGIVYPRA